jgi:hypothetical protein
MNLSDITATLVKRGFPKKDYDCNGVYTVPPDGRHWHLLPVHESSDGMAWLWVDDAPDRFVTLLFGANEQGEVTIVHAVEAGQGDAIATLSSIEQQSLDQLLADRETIAAAYDRWCETLDSQGRLLVADLAALLPSGWELGHDLVEGQR